MSRARDIANLVDANGDVVAGALDNVPASNDASALTTGTLDAARLPTTGVDASSLSTGTLDGARLPSTLPAIDGSALTGITTGKVLQVQQGTFTGRTTTTSTTFVDTGISVTITPSSTSSKIYISALCHLAWENALTKAAISLFRDSTEIFLGDADGSRSRTTSHLYLGEDSRHGWPITVTYLDSPATTSSVTYKIKYRRMDASGTVGINRGVDAYTNASNWGTSASGIQVMEIGA